MACRQGEWLVGRATIYVVNFLSPFHLHEMRRLFCFLEEKEYNTLKDDNQSKKVAMRTVELESEDSFWLQNILGQGSHAKQFQGMHLPPQRRVLSRIYPYTSSMSMLRCGAMSSLLLCLRQHAFLLIYGLRAQIHGSSQAGHGRRMYTLAQ